MTPISSPPRQLPGDLHEHMPALDMAKSVLRLGWQHHMNVVASLPREERRTVAWEFGRAFGQLAALEAGLNPYAPTVRE